jgi:glycosyltransferase involved in cell wall biosynthesis
MCTASVAVIIPVYNRPTTVLEALASVAAQTHPPGMLVVVDDGSSDGTARAVEHWMDSTPTSFPKILLRQANRGPSAARNRGSEIARQCEMLAFLDSDDLWPPSFLERACSLMEARPETVAATCDLRYRVYDDCGDDLFRTLSYLDTQGLSGNATLWHLTVRRGIMSATVVRAAAFQEVGRFDETMILGEDLKMHLYLSMLGPWLHVPGEAATVRLGISKKRNEESHLQLRSEGHELKLLRAIDQFLDRDGGRRLLPRGFGSYRLASGWYAYGRRLMRAHRFAGARKCFLRSIYWRITYHKSWLRFGRTFLPRAMTSPT